VKNLITVTAFSILCSSLLYAQGYDQNKVCRTAIKKLDFISGKWVGEGWMIGKDGQKQTFTQTENVQIKLDSMIILIEGTGKKGEHIIHNALAVISYNKTENKYDFHSYLSDGRSGTYSAELIGNTFYWYPMGNIRYVIEINEDGEWFETGEMKRGEEWFQFFEMTLKKVNI
jgi:hypothetical protein